MVINTKDKVLQELKTKPSIPCPKINIPVKIPNKYVLTKSDITFDIYPHF